jgi:hypothetical protein
MIEFIKSHWRSAIVVALVLVIAIQTKRLNLAHENSQKGLELKDGEIAKITVELGRLRAATKDGSSSTYIPPESKTTITVKVDREAQKKLIEVNAKLAELEKDREKNAAEIARLNKEREDLEKKATKVVVEGKRWGVTARLGLGALYSGKFLPELDCKVLYWGRYSVKLGITTEFGGVGVSRHIDDLVPFLNLQNLEVQGVYGREFGGGTRYAIGVRVNL